MKQLVRPLVVAFALIVPTVAAPAIASAQEVVQQAPPANLAAPPPDAPAIQEGGGQWVNTDSYGWIWVPNNSAAVEVNSQPYSYIYTPTYGWTWYVSPWGHGRYYAGPWVHTHWGYGPRVWNAGRWAAPPAHVGYRGRAAPAYHPAYRGAPHGGAPAHRR